MTYFIIFDYGICSECSKKLESIESAEEHIAAEKHTKIVVFSLMKSYKIVSEHTSFELDVQDRKLEDCIISIKEKVKKNLEEP